MNLNHICFYDFETGSRNKNITQPTQLSAVMIEPRKLEIITSSVFNSEIRPIIDDKEAIAKGLEPLQDEALRITHKNRESLANAPELKDVWNNFRDYVKKFNLKGDKWSAPIRAGFNIANFDNPIIDRLCEQFGPYDNEYKTQNLFHPIHFIDGIHDFWRMSENIKVNNTNSVSMDSLRTWLGISQDGAHDALNDVLDGATVLVRFMKLYRKLHTGIDCVKCKHPNKIKFEGAMASWKRPTV